MPSANYPGKLIVIEGADGAGKTDLCAALALALRTRGDISEVLEIREPGGCEFSEHARLILKGELIAGALTSHRAEALLFAAARAQLAEEVLRPALARGAIIICDRYIGSSIVYQGLARGIAVKDIIDISLFASDNLHVDRVLALQVSEATAASRRGVRDLGGDRIEDSTDKQVIRDGYANLKDLDPHEVIEISGEGSREDTLRLCLHAITDLLP
jgi:dTMP kinase